MGEVQRHLLVLHEDAPSLLHAKRAFEAEHGVRVTGARRSGPAITRLREDRFAAVLLHWRLPQHDGLKFLCRLHDEIPQRDRPPVLAFTDSWRSDDLRRALQLGVDAVLTTPLRPYIARAELNAITLDGESSSVHQLLAHASTVLLRRDPGLWQLELSDEWVERMVALAEILRHRLGGQPTYPPTVVSVVQSLASELGPDVNVDLLKTWLATSMRHAFAPDPERVKGLLPADFVADPLSDDAKARIASLGEVVEDAVDYVKLLQLKRQLTEVLAACPELDYDRLRKILPVPPEHLIGLLPSKTLERLRVLAAILANARDPVHAINAWLRHAHPSEKETSAIGDLLTVMGADGARQALWDVIAGPSTTPETVRTFLDCSELKKALESARALPDDEEEKAALLNNVGLALRGAGRYLSAESAYREALRLRPGSPSLLFNLAVVKHDVHAYGEALVLVEQVLERAPNMVRAQRLKTELESQQTR